MDAENLILEKRSERLSRGVEKLMGPRPTRRVLIKHWERRLRQATGGNPDTPLPDSKPRND
ncbi:MAG: hypothetical protein GOVbin2729_58 [Prokaryotic dsDNA virus sp.]|nr:MAG: hypothetical protein GOVbin2729_58 [Prokaryotic dsDNA virus sp.]